MLASGHDLHVAHHLLVESATICPLPFGHTDEPLLCAVCSSRLFISVRLEKYITFLIDASTLFAYDRPNSEDD